MRTLNQNNEVVSVLSGERLLDSRHDQSLNVNNSSPVSCGHNQDEITSVSGTKVDQLEADLFDYVVQEKKDNDQPSFLDRFQMAVDCFCQCKQLRSEKSKLKDLIARQGQFMFSVFEEGNNRGHALSILFGCDVSIRLACCAR